MSAQPNNPPSTDASEHTIPATAVASTSRCYLRPYEPSDAPALAEAANDLEIVRYMRSRFPSPYTLANAESWITFCSAPGEPSLTQAIFTPQGEFAGALTLEAAKGDSIYAGTRELGYFAARKLWGRGSKLCSFSFCLFFRCSLNLNGYLLLFFYLTEEQI